MVVAARAFSVEAAMVAVVGAVMATVVEAKKDIADNYFYIHSPSYFFLYSKLHKFFLFLVSFLFD